MLEISVTFEEFQLVFNFMLFFTLTLRIKHRRAVSQQSHQ